MYTEHVKEGRINLTRLMEICCTEPAKVSGSYLQKVKSRIYSDGGQVIAGSETVRSRYARPE